MAHSPEQYQHCMMKSLEVVVSVDLCVVVQSDLPKHLGFEQHSDFRHLHTRKAHSGQCNQSSELNLYSILEGISTT